MATEIRSEIKKEIWYAGELCHFVYEFESSNEAQQEINGYRALSKQACCLHKNGKHQL